MIGQLPAEAIDADLIGHLTGPLHLQLAVVVGEEDIAPVDEGNVPPACPLPVHREAEVPDRLVELAAAPVLDVALGSRAVDRERHLVYPRANQPPHLLLAEGEAVGARVEID